MLAGLCTLHSRAASASSQLSLCVCVCARARAQHAKCREAAKLVRKYTKARVDDEKQHMLLHWALADSPVVVNGRDLVRLLIKGAYRMPSPAAAPAGGGKAPKAARAQQPAAHGQVVRFITIERRVFIQPNARCAARTDLPQSR